MTTFNLNGKSVTVNADGNTPLLWVLRDVLGLTGTKYGCGIEVCWACTVHINGQPDKSCNITLSEIAGRNITTIEGLSADSSHPLQKAWIREQVPQCGYCQSGMIMNAAGLMASSKQNTAQGTADAITGEMQNICVCGTYQRIKAAVLSAVVNG